MATYEYRCNACEHQFETMQKITDEPLKKCPECGKKKLVRLFGAPGLVFKGTGFYATDYKNADKGPEV
jgi:putative FmdB family regulatory protein